MLRVFCLIYKFLTYLFSRLDGQFGELSCWIWPRLWSPTVERRNKGRDLSYYEGELKNTGRGHGLYEGEL